MKKVSKKSTKKVASKSSKAVKKSNKPEVESKFSKESAMKALAKRPQKFFDMISKGGHTIHELKKVGQCSGGLVRKLVWAGIAEMNEDKTIKLVKGINKKSLPEVDATPVKIRRAEKKEAKAKGEQPVAKKKQRREKSKRV